MVSIVCTCFEGDRAYLKKALLSAMIQDVSQEIIVVDASHTPMDRDLSIFVRTVAKLINVPNEGQWYSLNAGIEAASHELIIPLDADDRLDFYVVGKLIQVMNSEFDIVFGNCKDQDGEISKPYGRHGINKDAFMLCNPLFFTSLFKKDVWRQVGGFKPIIYTDYRFYVEAYKNLAKFRYTDLLVYQHTKREGSITDRYADKVEQLNQEAIQPLL